MNQALKIVAGIGLFLIFTTTVTAQSSASARASVTIMEPVALNNFNNEAALINYKETTYYKIVSLDYNSLAGLPGKTQKLRENILLGNVGIAMSNNGLYSITAADNIIFHHADGGSYLTGDLQLPVSFTGNDTINMQMDLYTKGKTPAGNYFSPPVDVIINFN